MALPNVKLHYLYRDGSNYKSHATAVFVNPNQLQTKTIWRMLTTAVSDVTLLPDMPYFRPEWVGLPTAFLFEQSPYSRNADDHFWHELSGVEETAESCAANLYLPIEAFIQELAQTHKNPFHSLPT